VTYCFPILVCLELLVSFILLEVRQTIHLRLVTLINAAKSIEFHFLFLSSSSSLAEFNVRTPSKVLFAAHVPKDTKAMENPATRDEARAMTIHALQVLNPT